MSALTLLDWPDRYEDATHGGLPLGTAEREPTESLRSTDYETSGELRAHRVIRITGGPQGGLGILDSPAERAQWCWQVLSYGAAFAQSGQGSIAVVVPDEKLARSEEAVAASTEWPGIWHEEPVERDENDGIVWIRHKREILFSGEMSIDASSLKPRKPHMVVDPDIVGDQNE